MAPPRKQAENRENKYFPTALGGSCLLEVYNTDEDIAAVVEAGNGSRYAVNFRVKNNLSNLYGLLAPQRKSLEKLVKPQMYIDVAAQYSKNPFKTAYRLNQASRMFAYSHMPQG